MRSFLAMTWCTMVAAAAIAMGGCSCSEEEESPAAACTPGSQGCECRAGSECDGDLACEQGLCSGGATATLTISNPAVRGCEVLVVDNGSRVERASFGEGVVGSFVREAPKLALSFVSAGDSPVPSGAVTLAIHGATGGEGSSAQVEVRRANCVGADGQPIVDAQIGLQ